MNPSGCPIGRRVARLAASDTVGPPVRWLSAGRSGQRRTSEKEGALRYVQGTASNGLAQQRFGVKIHLELLDTNELRVGSTSDYRQMMQPNEVWQFRALVVEPAAVSAAVIAIQEDQ